jgi:hypothetical protein
MTTPPDVQALAEAARRFAELEARFGTVLNEMLELQVAALESEFKRHKDYAKCMELLRRHNELADEIEVSPPSEHWNPRAIVEQGVVGLELAELLGGFRQEFNVGDYGIAYTQAAVEIRFVPGGNHGATHMALYAVVAFNDECSREVVKAICNPKEAEPRSE